MSTNINTLEEALALPVGTEVRFDLDPDGAYAQFTRVDAGWQTTHDDYAPHLSDRLDSDEQFGSTFNLSLLFAQMAGKATLVHTVTETTETTETSEVAA